MGNDQEYVEYVSARLPALRRFAYVLCGDPHQADDLVQRTITTLFVRWAKIRQADNLDRYVRAMLAHAFIDERRLAWSRVRLFRDPPERAVHDEGGDDRTAVRAALAKVPRRQRVVLVLRFNDLSASRHAKKERPDFERLMDVIRAGKLDVLVVWEISRNQRDRAVYVQIRDLCTEVGMHFWLVGGVLYDLRDKNPSGGVRGSGCGREQ